MERRERNEEVEEEEAIVKGYSWKEAEEKEVEKEEKKTSKERLGGGMQDE